jgi:diguanylate cyclase (GGDEF)-like protein/PAS domain S-box-containing protein
VSQAPREAHRLDALAATRLLDSDAEAAFDRLTRLASQLLHAPVALVSLIDDRRQFFKSAFGLGEPWSRRRETPLSHSFCQHVVRERSVLRVDDAPSDPRVKGNLAIRDMNVQAYLGTPLMVDDEALGSFCVIDVKPRHWTDAEEKLLRDLGDSVVAEIELRLALRHAHEQRTLTGALLDGLAEGVLAVSPKHEFLVVNAAARSIMGDRRRVGGTVIEDRATTPRSPRADGSELPPEEAPLVRALQGESTESLEFSVQQAGATAPTWLEASGRPVRDAKGEIIAAVSVFRDVTERKRISAELARNEQLYRAMVQHLPNGAILLVDQELRYVAAEGPILPSVLANARLESVIGRSVAEVSADGYRDQLLSVYRSALRGDHHHFEIQRGERFYDLDVVPLGEGADRQVMVFLYDVTTRKREMTELESARAKLERQAKALEEASVTDELTGLLNRRGFLLIAEQEMRVAQRNKQKMVLFFADLNGMKAINDTLGHKVGDEALKATALLLRGVFRSSDVIARLGGDEYVVLATDAAATSGDIFANRLRELASEYNTKGGAFVLSISVGTSIYDPMLPLSLEAMLAEADQGMYAHKQITKRSGNLAAPSISPASVPGIRKPMTSPSGLHRIKLT